MTYPSISSREILGNGFITFLRVQALSVIEQFNPFTGVGGSNVSWWMLAPPIAVGIGFVDVRGYRHLHTR